MADIGTLLGSAQTVVGAATQIKATIDKLTGKTPAQVNGGTGSLNAFKANFADSHYVMRNNRFIMNIPSPKMLISRGSSVSTRVAPMLPFVCETGVMPGVSIATSEVRRHGVGPVEKRPYSVNFVDMTATMIVDKNGLIHSYFKEWINGIVGFDELITSPKNESLPPYEVEYRDDYTVDIQVFVYDESNQKLYDVTIYNAYPIFIGDVSLSWGSNDDFVRLPVSFSYTSWKSNTYNNLGSVTVRNIGTMERLMAAGSALNMLASIRKPTSVGDVLNIVNNTTSAIGGLRTATKGLF